MIDDDEFPEEQDANRSGHPNRSEKNRRLKEVTIRRLLSKNSKINEEFDKFQRNQVVESDEYRTAFDRRVRPSGRPYGGKVRFEQKRIDNLPEIGCAADIARSLGIRRASLQQWTALKENPLPFVKDDDRMVFRKDVLVNWLVSTGRFKRKPEYER